MLRLQRLHLAFQLGCSALRFAGDLPLPIRQRLRPLGPTVRAGQLAAQPAQVALLPFPPSRGSCFDDGGLLPLVGQLATQLGDLVLLLGSVRCASRTRVRSGSTRTLSCGSSGSAVSEATPSR